MLNRRASRTLFLLGLLLLPGWYQAQAYVDPATGSFVLQMLIAGFLGALFALKLFWRRLVNMISGLFRRSPAAGRDEG